MVFYDEAEARKLYERYKLQWMVYHGLGLVDLMDCRALYRFRQG